MISDEQIENVFRQTKNYTHTGRILQLDRHTIERRVLQLRAKGKKLPYPKRGAPVRKADNGAKS